MAKRMVCCRTLGILDFFGFGDRAWKEANHTLEIYLRNPDSNGTIQSSARIPETITGIRRFEMVVLHQGRIEHFLDFLVSCSDLRVERGVLPTKRNLDESLVESLDAYPITYTYAICQKPSLPHSRQVPLSMVQQTRTASSGATSPRMISTNSSGLVRWTQKPILRKL
jgi:phenol 2-monooxygenase